MLTLGCKGLNLTWNVIFSFFTSPPLPPPLPPLPLLSEVGVHFFTVEAGKIFKSTTFHKCSGKVHS